MIFVNCDTLWYTTSYWTQVRLLPCFVCPWVESVSFCSCWDLIDVTLVHEFLQPCCRRWNKTKSMLLMPEQSQTHVFINFYLTQPSPMVALPKGQFGWKGLQYQQFFAYRLHCIRLCHPNKIYLLLTYYMLVVRLDWYDPGEDSRNLPLPYFTESCQTKPVASCGLFQVLKVKFY